MGNIYRATTAFTGAPALPVVPDALPAKGVRNRWDADTILAANGAVLTGWADSAAGLNMGVAVGDPRVETVDGHRAVRFTNDIMQTALSLPQPHTVVLAFKHVSLNTTGTATVFGAQQAIGTDGGIFQTNTVGDFYANAGTAFKIGGQATAGWKRLIVVFNGASSVVNLNGVEYAGNFGTQHREFFSLGGQRSAQFTDIAVTHASVFSKALTTQERTDLAAWLTGKVA